MSAAAGVLYEHLGLEATKITRTPKYDYRGADGSHEVCLIEADGEPILRRLEVDSFIWWDMKEPVPVLPHVNAILRKMGIT